MSTKDSKEMEYIFNRYGTFGYIVFLKLLSIIYRENGYYAEYTQILISELAKECRTTNTKKIIKLINELSEDDFFFNSYLKEEKYILTSKEIQLNFLNLAKKRKVIKFHYEIILFNEKDINFNTRFIIQPDKHIYIKGKPKQQKKRTQKEKYINLK